VPSETVINKQIAGRLKALAKEVSGQNRRSPNNMRIDLFKLKQHKLDLRFFRGMLVKALWCNDTQVDSRYSGWYTARVIGKGNLKGTYELQFDDPSATYDQNRHVRNPPYKGERSDDAVGQHLGDGAAAIKLVADDDEDFWSSDVDVYTRSCAEGHGCGTRTPTQSV